MKKADKSIREKIKLATINCIGRDGILNLTTRKIAKEAGVNSAAINYYFGSKEKLVKAALKQTMDEMTQLPEEFLSIENMEPRARLQAFFMAIMEGIYFYPGITTAHLYNPLMKNEYSSPFVRRFISFFEDMLCRTEGIKLKDPTKDSRVIMIQIFSAIILPAVMPRMFKDAIRGDLSKKANREAYVKDLLDHYFE